jgi:hypothetical protein
VPGSRKAGEKEQGCKKNGEEHLVLRQRWEGWNWMKVGTVLNSAEQQRLSD